MELPPLEERLQPSSSPCTASRESKASRGHAGVEMSGWHLGTGMRLTRLMGVRGEETPHENLRGGTVCNRGVICM